MSNWLPININAIPETLYQLPAAVWRAEPRAGRQGGWNKAPRHPESLQKIGPNNPLVFGSLSEAIKTYQKGAVDGIGVLLTGDGLVGIDIDGVEELLAGDNGEELARWLDKARAKDGGKIPPYIERSPSGNGLRIFVRGSLSADGAHRRGGLEIYADKRFLTITGVEHPKLSAKNYEIGDRQDLIDEFEYLISCKDKKDERNRLRTSEEVIGRICRKVQEQHPHLWEGQWRDLGKYPSQSEADLALLGYIGREVVSCGLSQDRWGALLETCFSNSGLFRGEKVRTLREHSVPKILESMRIKPLVSTSVREAFSDLILRDEDVEKMRDADFLIPNMIVRGHVAAYIAPGNGGKTTIFTYLSGILAQSGADVFYINVDGSPGDLKRHREHAAVHDYQIIAPDARAGGSIAAVLVRLREFAAGAADLSNAVFIFDTLKKFVNVIEKREARAFYQLLRALTVKGATICLLGHSNKYKDKDDQQIFEGTADLRNDVDELIYFDIFTNEKEHTLEITTRPDKVRAEFSPKSFVIHLDEDRKVTEPDRVITVMEKSERGLLDQIVRSISRGNRSQKDIIGDVRQTSEQSEKRIREVLIKHARQEEVIKSRPTGRGRDLDYSLVDPAQSFPF